MSSNKNYKVPEQFENIFKIVSSPRFLNKEGLSGELPFFIHSFPIEMQTEVYANIQSLLKRMTNNNIDVFEVNLYKLAIDILKKEEIFEQIINQEEKLPKQRLLRVISGPLNIDSIVVPEIHRQLLDKPSKMIFLTGIDTVFPIIRSHTILNNLQTLVGDIPLVMFFPGTYNNQSLTLFNKLKDDNYYRAHNLNGYKV
jgi:hypothetical protein